MLRTGALTLAPQMMGCMSLSAGRMGGMVETATEGGMMRRRNGNTPNRLMRGRITSKTGPKNFYKGRGCPSYGFHTRSGLFFFLFFWGEVGKRGLRKIFCATLH